MKIEFTLKIICRAGVGREFTRDDRCQRAVYHIERFIKFERSRGRPLAGARSAAVLHV